MLLFAVVNMRQLESAAVRLHHAEWRPPYAGIVTICRLQARLHGRYCLFRTCASSNPPRCGSLSLNGVRHMPVSSPSAVCKLACTADTADTGRMFILSACSSFVHVAV